MTPPRPVAKLEGGGRRAEDGGRRIGQKWRRRRAVLRPAYCCEGRGRRAEGGEADLGTVRRGVFSYPDQKNIFNTVFYEKCKWIFTKSSFLGWKQKSGCVKYICLRNIQLLEFYSRLDLQKQTKLVLKSTWKIMFHKPYFLCDAKCSLFVIFHKIIIMFHKITVILNFGKLFLFFFYWHLLSTRLFNLIFNFQKWFLHIYPNHFLQFGLLKVSTRARYVHNSELGPSALAGQEFFIFIFPKVTLFFIFVSRRRKNNGDR